MEVLERISVAERGTVKKYRRVCKQVYRFLRKRIWTYKGIILSYLR